MTVCPDAMLQVGKFAAAHDRLFTMNLSAPFLCTAFKDQLSSLLPYVDILFGNELVSLLSAFFHLVTVLVINICFVICITRRKLKQFEQNFSQYFGENADSVL